MLSNLYIQLGGNQQDGGFNKLESYVIEQLIKQRLQDLEMSHQEIPNTITELEESKEYEEWIPLLKSINIALKQEINDLSTSTKEKEEKTRISVS
jgi:hypothetical protein